MLSNQRNKRKQKQQSGILNVKPVELAIKYQKKRLSDHRKFVKNYSASNSACHAVPAQHPRPLSAAERNQQEAAILTANNRVYNIDAGNLGDSVEERVNTSLSEIQKMAICQSNAIEDLNRKL
ncbi:hypothetical protein MAM1_0057d03646 [Mucor ambiguus]|uniref:Uncharacterized protein n=1 Tax=Mucor ambiguus TaxID=91626 RepID=A0A0C9M4J2_9FUNG|nr:hypothetical protein MAM1_0057d03646 [Mucor ambiguus]